MEDKSITDIMNINKEKTMVDIHCHVLFHVDDGADSLEESKKICKISAEQGITHIAATPHFILEEIEQDISELENKIEILNNWCRENDLDLEILIGCESYIHPYLPKYVAEKKVPTINNTRYLLVEFPMDEMPIYAEDILYQLALKGFIPIIAHPERYSYIRKNPQRLFKLVEKGYLVQCNAGSFLGYFGDSVKRCAASLLKHNLVHVIGSDSHRYGSQGRGQCMDKAMEEIAKLGFQCTPEVLINNSKSIINNKSVEYMEPINYEVKKKKENWVKTLIKSFNKNIRFN